MERTATRKPDGINGALWSLCGYDVTMQHFAALRRELMMHEGHEATTAQLDRVLLIYINDMIRTLHRTAGSTETVEQYVTRRDDSLGADRVTEVLYRLIATASQDTELAIALVSYACTLALETAHGMAPWNRFCDAVTEMYYEVRPAMRSMA